MIISINKKLTVWEVGAVIAVIAKKVVRELVRQPIVTLVANPQTTRKLLSGKRKQPAKEEHKRTRNKYVVARNPQRTCKVKYKTRKQLQTIIPGLQIDCVSQIV